MSGTEHTMLLMGLPWAIPEQQEEEGLVNHF